MGLDSMLIAGKCDVGSKNVMLSVECGGRIFGDQPQKTCDLVGRSSESIIVPMAIRGARQCRVTVSPSKTTWSASGYNSSCVCNCESQWTSTPIRIFLMNIPLNVGGASHFGCLCSVTDRFVTDHWFTQRRLQSQTMGFEEMSLKGRATV